MPLSIQSNQPSLVAQKYLTRNVRQLNQSLERLSSGLRINSAADDATGLAISERLRADIRSYAVAERNTGVGISMATTAEAGAGEIGGVLIRMRELAVEAANGSLTATDRSLLDTEFQQLKEEVDRLADATEFDDTELLVGAATTISFQVGIGTSSSDQIAVGFGGVGTTTLGISASDLDGSTATGAQSAITSLDSAINVLSSKRASLGSAINRLGFALSADEQIRTELTAAASIIRDVNIASETSSLARYQVLVEAGIAVLAQANQVPSLALSLLST